MNFKKTGRNSICFRLIGKVCLISIGLGFFSGMAHLFGADFHTNQLMIGNVEVQSVVTNNKIVGDRWIVVSNTLICIHAEVSPIDDIPQTNKQKLGRQAYSQPSLRLMLATGDGTTQFAGGGVWGLHGLAYMATKTKMPGLSRRTPVDILATADRTRIIVMIRDNGPIYSSTNSGMSWICVNKPGTHEFDLTSGPDGCGYYAQATIRPSSKKQHSTDALGSNWYVVGSTPNGKQIVLTHDDSQPAPVLTIKHSSQGIIVSWPATFNGFQLQKNKDFVATNWQNITNNIDLVGDQNQVFLVPVTANEFYRLKSTTP